MKAYKGFNKDMTCRGFKYEEGKEYETEQAIACQTGFHACEYPLDVFMYYNPAESVFHEVEQSGELSRNGDDTKVSSTKIKIGAEISIAGLVKAAIEYVRERVTQEAEATDEYGASSATGEYGASSVTGDCGVSSNTGYCGSSSAGHENSIAVAFGYDGKAKGVLGSWLTIAEWEYIGEYGQRDLDANDPEKWLFKEVKTVRVDGEIIKADTFYRLVNGEFVIV